MEAGARLAAAQQDGRIWDTANVVRIADQALCFRAFRLLPASRILLHHEAPVEIGSRAFDLLHILLRSRGVVVERADIIRHVWPTTTIEESNLRVQVAYVRKVLGEDRELLKTVPGRGYLLAADIQPETMPGEPRSAATSRAQEDAEALRALLHTVLAELRDLRRGGATGA